MWTNERKEKKKRESSLGEINKKNVNNGRRTENIKRQEQNRQK